jgi:hypothetical protein
MWHVQAGAQYTDHSFADVINIGTIAPPDYLLASYTTYDAAAGVAKDAWTFEFFGDNLTDTRAQVYISSASFQTLTTTNRPRVLGVRFSYKFGDRANR